MRRTDFARLASEVQAATEQWLSATDWKPLRLVGITSVLCQLTASLYFTRRLKQCRPDLTFVVGGAAFNSESGAAALVLFPHAAGRVFQRLLVATRDRRGRRP